MRCRSIRGVLYTPHAHLAHDFVVRSTALPLVVYWYTFTTLPLYIYNMQNITYAYYYDLRLHDTPTTFFFEEEANPPQMLRAWSILLLFFSGQLSPRGSGNCGKLLRQAIP